VFDLFVNTKCASWFDLSVLGFGDSFSYAFYWSIVFCISVFVGLFFMAKNTFNASLVKNLPSNYS